MAMAIDRRVSRRSHGDMKDDDIIDEREENVALLRTHDGINEETYDELQPLTLQKGRKGGRLSR